MNKLNCKSFISISKSFNNLYTKRLFCATTLEPQRQSELFVLEKQRQIELIGRIEKIEVNVQHGNENVSLMMNKHISTPYQCAKHLSETVTKRSAVALLNGDTLWHMHKPLPDSCNLEFLHYQIPQPALVNKAYWRTCSFVLGAVATNAFNDNVDVQLHSFPIPNVRSGSYVYDIQLSLPDWKPTQNELRTLSLEMIKFCQKNHQIDCLEVSQDFALLMFKNNPHKTQQIPDIASHNNGKVSLYKVGDHIDISKGPMISNTSQIGRVTITNVIKLDTDIKGSPIYRFQGVSLPSSVVINHFAYGLLEDRARSLNPAKVPGAQGAAIEDNSFISEAVN